MPLEFTNNTQHKLRPITSITKGNYKLSESLKIQSSIGKIITDLYSKKEQNDIQTQTLTTLRDTLLSKLMNGEVRVEF